MIDYKLMPHQEDIIKKSMTDPDLYLAWEMGTGKSCAIVNILRHRFSKADRILRTLILSPLITLPNWKNEFGMYSMIQPKSIVTLEIARKRVAAIKALDGRSAILVLNYDALSSQNVLDEILKWKPEILVCDEAHYLKNFKSKRAKSAIKISEECSNVYMLSGTPILNNAMDLFMQYRVMDGRHGRLSTFGANYYVYRDTYFQDKNAAWKGNTGYFPNFQPRPSSFKELSKRIDQKTSRVVKADVLKNLPPLVTENVYASMGKEQAQAYANMKRDFVAYVKELTDQGEPKAVVAKLALTKALRLQQIVSGFATLEDGTEYIFEDNPRLNILKEALVPLVKDHKVIIWSVFKQNYKTICKMLEEEGIKYTEVHGGIKNKFDNVDEFNNNPECRVLVGNPGAGGIGINLVASSYSLYYSRGFKLGDDLQSEARNHRRGSEIHEKITRLNLITPGTIDELVAESLAAKQNISDRILDWKG
jgi:SNF2 family DNA or RNA helicase